MESAQLGPAAVLAGDMLGYLRALAPRGDLTAASVWWRHGVKGGLV